MRVNGSTWTGAVLTTIATAALVAGCSGGGNTGDGGSATPQRGGTLTLALNVESMTMDPSWCATSGFDRCAPVFGTLLRYDVQKREFGPGMAQSFESEDGKTWTLRLRDGVKFSDGTPFDAEAVAFNWQRVKDPEMLSPAAGIAEDLTWKAIDATTLQVTSAEPNFQLPWALVKGLGMIGSPTAIKKAGKGFGNAPVGAGPFVLDKWVRNSQANYSANPGYFEKGLPYLDQYVIKVIAQDDQRLNALRAREIDIDWSLLAKDAKRVEEEGFTVHQLPLVGGTGMLFNFEDPELKDSRLRQALQKVFDSKQINDAVYPGDRPVDAFLFPSSPYRDDSFGTYPALDVDAAQTLFDDFLADTGRDELTVTFSTYAGIPALDQVAQLMQSQAQKIKGLTFKIKTMDSVALAGALRSGDFQLAMAPATSQHMDALYEAFHSDGSTNHSGYSNAKVDAALETSRRSSDETKVAEAYKIVAGEISKDAPLRTWRYQSGHLFTGSYVKDLVIAGTHSGVGAYVERAWLDH